MSAGSIALRLRQGKISWWEEHVEEAAHLTVAQEVKKGRGQGKYPSRACLQ
jgi:hypothetical protein